MSFYDECIQQGRFDLLRQWDTDKNLPLTPKTITVWNKKKVHWICEKGHSWKIAIQGRLPDDAGCPVCGCRTIIPGVNDAGTVYGKLKRFWNSKRNKVQLSKLSPKHGGKLWWKCENGHEWSESIQECIKHDNCPVCMGFRKSTKFVSFAEKNPDLLKEWDYEKNTDINPEEISANTHKKAWWKCEKGHKWYSQIKSRTEGSGCPICTSKVLKQGFNDLLTVYPESKKYWDYEKNGDLRPETVFSKSSTVVWWKCEKGHSFSNKIYVQTNNLKGCPYCYGKKVVPGENDLETRYPEHAAEWNYEKNGDLKPSDVTPFSNRRVWWKCNEGHEWDAVIGTKVLRSAGCPYCSGKKILSGFNDMKTLYPKVASEWNYEKNGEITPEMISPSAKIKAWWICPKGHEYESLVFSRTFGECGCPYCTGKKVLIGFNDLKTTDPKIADEWFYELNDGLTPETVTRGSQKKVWWRCRLGHVWKTSINARTSKQTACPVCGGHAGNSTVLSEDEVGEMLKKAKE